VNTVGIDGISGRVLMAFKRSRSWTYKDNGNQVPFNCMILECTMWYSLTWHCSRDTFCTSWTLGMVIVYVFRDACYDSLWILNPQQSLNSFPGFKQKLADGKQRIQQRSKLKDVSHTGHLRPLRGPSCFPGAVEVEPHRTRATEVHGGPLEL
jgi:hypothetical protein